jgi:uncharacterized membrane protein
VVTRVRNQSRAAVLGGRHCPALQRMLTIFMPLGLAAIAAILVLASMLLYLPGPTPTA